MIRIDKTIYNQFVQALLEQEESLGVFPTYDIKDVALVIIPLDGSEGSAQTVVDDIAERLWYDGVEVRADET